MKLQTAFTVKKLYRLLKLGALGTFPFGVFCFLPERLLTAALLIIFLVVFLILVSKPRTINSTNPKIKSVLALKPRCEKKTEEISSNSSLNKKINGPSIVRLVKSGGSDEHAFSQQRRRSRNEMNDQLLEGRIRSLFERIRTSDGSSYQKGLQEIQNLLEMRQKCLSSLSSTKKMS